jgi:hypothetical protein
MSIVSTQSLPFFSLPYSIGVNDTTKFVPIDPKGARTPSFGSTENSFADLFSELPESDVNFAVKSASFFCQLVRRNETEEVISKPDSK